MISNRLTTAYARRLATRKNRGLTLMEVAMVLAIIGIVIAAALLYFNSANTSQKIVSSFGQLAQIQQSVRSLYSGQANYNGLNTAQIATSEALPASMINGNTIRHAFNAGVTIDAEDAAGGPDSGFAVVFLQVPEDACKQMLTKDLGRGLFSAGAQGAALRTQQTGLPFTLAQATAACNATYNDITWVFN